MLTYAMAFAIFVTVVIIIAALLWGPMWLYREKPAKLKPTV